MSHLSSGGFTDSSSPSTKADALLSQRFHQGDPNLVFLLQAPAGVNSPAARTVGLDLTGRPGSPALRDRRGLLLVRPAGAARGRLCQQATAVLPW